MLLQLFSVQKATTVVLGNKNWKEAALCHMVSLNFELVIVVLIKNGLTQSLLTNKKKTT